MRLWSKTCLYVMAIFAPAIACAGTIVQSKHCTTSTSGTSVSCTFTNATTTGDWVLVGVRFYDGNGDISGSGYPSTITDSGSAVYTTVNISSVLVPYWVFSSYAQITSGGASYQVTYTTPSAANNFATMDIVEVSGITGFDVSGTNSTTSVSSSLSVSTSSPTTTANSFLFSTLLAEHAASDFNPTIAGWTRISTSVPADPPYGDDQYFNDSSGTGTKTAAWSYNDSPDNAAGIILAFKNSSGSTCTSHAYVNGTGASTVPTSSSTSVWLESGNWGTVDCSTTPFYSLDTGGWVTSMIMPRTGAMLAMWLDSFRHQQWR